MLRASTTNATARVTFSNFRCEGPHCVLTERTCRNVSSPMDHAKLTWMGRCGLAGVEVVVHTTVPRTVVAVLVMRAGGTFCTAKTHPQFSNRHHEYFKKLSLENKLCPNHQCFTSPPRTHIGVCLSTQFLGNLRDKTAFRMFATNFSKSRAIAFFAVAMAPSAAQESSRTLQIQVAMTKFAAKSGTKVTAVTTNSKTEATQPQTTP